MTATATWLIISAAWVVALVVCIGIPAAWDRRQQRRWVEHTDRALEVASTLPTCRTCGAEMFHPVTHFRLVHARRELGPEDDPTYWGRS